MKDRRLLLVQPLGRLTSPSGYMRTCYLEPITIEYLAGAAEAAGFPTEMLSGDVNAEQLAAAVSTLRPFVIGFSVHTYVADAAVELARAAKATARRLGYDVVTVFGGPHPTALPEEMASLPEVDYVAVGEGEGTLCELLEAISTGGNESRVRGVVFEQDGAIVRTGPRERIRDLDALPPPKRERRFLDSARQYQIAYPPPGQQVRIAQVMYSRGCPFGCSFCSSQNMWGSEVVWRSPGAVLDEIEGLVADHGTNLVYFPDLTLNVERSRLLALCDAFRVRQPPVHWWGLFRADLLDDELIDALSEAGCVKISLGLESANDHLAAGMKGNYVGMSRAMQERLAHADAIGMIIKAFLIVGFPTESEDDIRSYRDALVSLPIDELRVTFATPFPGTRLWEEYRATGLLPTAPDLTRLTTEAPVILHPTASRDGLLAARQDLVTNFYLDPRYGKRVLGKVRRHPQLQRSWVEFLTFLRDRDVFSGREPELAELVAALGSTRTGPQLVAR